MNATLPESPTVIVCSAPLETVLASYDPFASCAARAHYIHMRPTRGF